jgi:tetratricopeptide (TPR) repeat protein
VEKRLDSWKEIASYLDRHVTTVRRWEREEGLPVHRHVHSKLGSIYAYAHELDTWFGSRRREVVTIESERPSALAPDRLPPPPSVASAPRPIVFSGRAIELQTLQELWDLACRERQQVALISGPAGVGKTSVATEFARGIAGSATVLTGRCDREALAPFAPFIAIVEWLVRASPPSLLRRLVTDIDGNDELAQLVPELTTRIQLPVTPTSTTVEGQRYRMFEACAQLLVAISRRGPVLVVIDDIQWADRGSMLMLRHLIRATRDAALLFIVTCRDDERDRQTESHDILEDLAREHELIRLPLKTLAEDDVRRMIEGWIRRPAAPSLVRFVMHYSEGNALFVTEMLRHLTETEALASFESSNEAMLLPDIGIPTGIRDLISRRLDRLTALTLRLLTLAAVMGREFRLSVIEALADVGEDAVLDAMDEALAARLVTESPGAPGHFSFSHALIRETLYGRISAARRVRLHHRIALTLERHASQTTVSVSELAYHFTRAAVHRDAAKAVEYAIHAGDRATAALAMEDAALHYQRALDAIDFVPGAAANHRQRFDLHVKRGRNFANVGQWAAAKNAFEAAASLLNHDDEVQRCELLVRLAETSFWLMDLTALRTYANEAQTLADRIGRDDLWADAMAWLASANVSDGDVGGGVEMDRATVTRAGGIRSFALARVPLTLYWVGRLDEAAEQAADAVARARASDDPAFLLYALQHLGLSLSGRGRYDDALRAFDEARAFGRHAGALPLLARATSMSVAPLLSLGDLDAAMTRAFEAREIAHRVAFEPPLVSAAIDLLLIFARSQDPGRAEALFEDTARAVQHSKGWHAWKWNMRLWQARAELAVARGAWHDAVDAATHVIDQSRPRQRLNYEALALATRARASARLGSRRAADDARAATQVARTLADPAVLLDCLAVLLQIDGNDALLTEARQTAETMRGAIASPSLRSAFVKSASAKCQGILGQG